MNRGKTVNPNRKLLSLFVSALFLMLLFHAVGFEERAKAEEFFTDIKVNDNEEGNKLLSPSIAVERNGKVYVVWQDYRNGPLDSDIYFSNSTNNGTTFSRNVRVNDDTGGEIQMAPDVAIGPNGTVYVVWEDNRNGDSDVYFARSEDGMSFEENIRVDDGGQGKNVAFPAITVDETGTIHVVWQDDRLGEYDIFYSNSTDGGKTFTPATKVSDTTGGKGTPSVAAAGGKVFVIWDDFRDGDDDPNIYFANSTDGGQTFGGNFKVNDDPATGDKDQHDPDLAVDGSGTVYAVWHDERLKDKRSDIFFSKSLDSGFSWSQNIPVNDTSGTSDTMRQSPQIVLDESSVPTEIHVTWADNRDEGDRFYDVFLANSTDGGSTFGANEKVNHNDQGSAQWFPSIDVDGSGNLYCLWVDNRSGSIYPDVYFSCTLEDNWKPELEGVAPLGTDIPVSTSIIMAFSEPMNLTAFPRAFSINPEVLGNFTTDGQIVTFTPYFNLFYETTYNISISTEARDIAGNPLKSSYSWNFTTEEDAGPPTVLRTSPADGELSVSVEDLRVEVQFSESMNESSASGFEMRGPEGEPVPGTSEWRSEIFVDDKLLFIPEKVDYSTKYTVVLNSSSLMDRSGNLLDGDSDGIQEGSPADDFIFSFETEALPTPPAIDHMPVTRAFVGENITIETNVSDDGGVANVTLYYLNVGETLDMKSVDMNLSSGTRQNGTWTAAIPAQNETGMVHYYIKAADANQSAISPANVSDPPEPDELYEIEIVEQGGTWDVWNLGLIALVILIVLLFILMSRPGKKSEEKKEEIREGKEESGGTISESDEARDEPGGEAAKDREPSDDQD